MIFVCFCLFTWPFLQVRESGWVSSRKKAKRRREDRQNPSDLTQLGLLAEWARALDKWPTTTVAVVVPSVSATVIGLRSTSDEVAMAALGTLLIVGVFAVAASTYRDSRVEPRDSK